MDYKRLKKSPLFYGLEEDQVAQALACLDHRTRSYRKGDLIAGFGEEVQSLGLVQKGAVLIENYDYWGNRSVLGLVGENQIFAESYVFTGQRLQVHVIASEDSEILFIRGSSLTGICPKACPCHRLLIQNLLALTCQHNLNLSQRIFNTSAKTIRGRLVSYLSHQAQVQGKNQFTIPFNRQELADFLNVDRSALSKELGKMRDEGLLQFHKNYFHLA